MRKIEKACFLDFDHTLFNTDGFFHVDVRDSFLRFGIDIGCWEQSYNVVWQTGYNLEKHIEEVFRQSGSQPPLSEMKAVIQSSFSDLGRYLFPDVLSFLQAVKRDGVHLYLLSFGNPEWQRYKVFGARIDNFFDDMFFTPRESGKARVVFEYAKGFQQLVVVDNNPSELDLIKDTIPIVKTYCISRVPDETAVPKDELSRLKFLEARRYLEKEWRYQHIACRTLDDILIL